ncbi:low molecular weight phosphatase family protein [Microbacterium sp. P07]|uniref:arsenate reductase/protein-tyrosine-phosphatase family protein n=1 Tax=Microbacterium sp. P07 TaxID=3366952 RepID=UPI0037456B0D
MLDLDLSSMFRGGGNASASPTIEILTVCTGNICRSPLAEQVLRAALTPLDVEVSSAGTHALVDRHMTRESAKLAASFGVPHADSNAHRARWLTELHLAGPDLVLTMTREHRSHVVGLAPARLRSTFTVREFERLAKDVADDDLRAVTETAGADTHARVRAALTLLRTRRDQVEAPTDPADDDVVDPYRQSWEVYERSAEELAPGLAEATRVIRIAIG